MDAFEFQSPSGVLGVCRTADIRDLASVVRALFQSPSGVLGVCRATTASEDAEKHLDVSVPFRGFRGLQGTCP